MSIRKITSLTAALSFVVVMVTSVILYIVPQGRVAYWADWRLWGLTKEAWGAVHINIGLLFLLSLFLHIYYNWKPLMAYLRDRSRRMKIFTPAFNLSLLICTVTIAGTLFVIPPFSWVLDLNTAFKDSGARKYGEPPYGHAELSTLDAFAKQVDIDAQAARQRLLAAGFKIPEGKQTLKGLATINQTTPKSLFDVMTADERHTRPVEQALPETPPPGTGRLSLLELCNTYGMDPQVVLAALKAKNIPAEASETLRDIAGRHGMGAMDLYEIVRLSANTLGQSG